MRISKFHSTVGPLTRNVIAALAIAAAAGIMAQPASATPFIWTGTTSGVWGLNSNWNPNTGFPSDLSADTATFNLNNYGTKNPIVATDSVNGIAIGGTATVGGGSALALTGTQLTIGSGGISMATGNSGSSIAPTTLVVGAAQTWQNNAATTLTIGTTSGGVINTSGFSPILNTTSTGGLTVNYGSGDTAFASISSTSTGVITINNAGTGTLSTGTVSMVGGLTINNAGSNLSFSGAVTTGAASTINNTGTGNISFSGAVTTGAASSINNTGTGNISFASTLTTGAGLLTVNNSSAGTITMSGNVTLGAGGLAINGTGGGTATLLGTISGSGPFTVNGNVVIDGLASYGGTTGLASTTVGANGTLEFANGTAVQTLGTITNTNKGGLLIQSDWVSGTSGLIFSSLGGHTVGSTLGFVVQSGGPNSIKINTTNVAYLGTFVTLGTGASTTYALTASGVVGAYTGTPITGDDIDQMTAAGTNYEETTFSNATLTDNRTGNSLRYSGGAQTISTAGHTLTLNGLLNAGTGKLTLDGTGTGGVTIGGNNELVLNAANADIEFTGQYNYSTTTAQTITIAGPNKVMFNQINNTSSGTITFVNGSSTVGAGQLVINSSQLLTFNPTSTGGIVVFNAIADNAAGASGILLPATATGPVTLNGFNTYTGVTTLHGGVLAVANLANVNTASGIGKGFVGGSAADLIIGGGDLRFTGISSSTDRLFTIGDSNGTSATLENNGTSTTAAGMNFTSPGSIAFGQTGPHTLTFTGTQDANSSLVASALFAPIIADSAAGAGNATSVIKSGAASTNMWTLSGANTYSGGTLISGGSLRSTTAGVAGVSPGAFGTGTVTVTSGGNAYLAGTGVYENNFSIAGVGPVLKSGGVTYQAGAITLTAGITVGNSSSTITLTNDAWIGAVGTASSSATIAGQLTGTGNLTLGTSVGNGVSSPIYVLSNTANNFSGNLSIINIGTNGSGNQVTFKLGASEVIPDTSNFIFNHSGTSQMKFDANGKSETIAGIVSAGSAIDLLRLLTNSATGNSVITLGSSAPQNFMGQITDTSTAASLGFTKVGTGTQTFAGSGHNYHGDTTITSGTLSLDYSQYASSNSVNPSNAFSQNSAMVLNGGTLGVIGRSDGQAEAPTTTATAASGATTIALSSVAGLVVGQQLTVSGVTAGTYIVGFSGNTIQISAATTASITSGSTINFASTSSTTAQTFKSLALAANSILDFGPGSATTLQFNGETQPSDGSVLTINNWDGVADTGGGMEKLLFTIPDVSAFQNTFSQGEIQFSGFSPGYALIQQGATTVYEVVPTSTSVPEPASLALLGMGGVALLARRRRQA